MAYQRGEGGRTHQYYDYDMYTTASASGLDYGGLSPPPPREQKAPEDDIYEVPVGDFYAARNSHRGRRDITPVVGCDMPPGWHGAEPNQPSQAETLRFPELEVRKFASCRYDPDLQDYLATRSISVGFLSEIDQFLVGHPEIATCEEGRRMIYHLNALPPLAAYRHFLKGYTRPARYINGVIRTDAFTLPMDFTYQTLSSTTDMELVEFFDGFYHRNDVIECIDKEVCTGVQTLASGGNLSVALRKLVCYAVWGNPVDAYKWFEHSYQEKRMSQRYVPEHTVLRYVPKPENYTEPCPGTRTEDLPHGNVRALMARAYDQYFDVLEVLIAEYRQALMRSGHRRSDIDGLVRKAWQRLEKERQDETGVDVVDLIMDDAVARHGA